MRAFEVVYQCQQRRCGDDVFQPGPSCFSALSLRADKAEVLRVGFDCNGKCTVDRENGAVKAELAEDDITADFFLRDNSHAGKQA